MVLKDLLKNKLSDFIWFYLKLGPKIFLSIILSILVGLLDSIGLSMFLPLLQIFNENQTFDKSGLGNFELLINWITSTGLEMNLTTILYLIVVFFVLKGISKYISEILKIILQQNLLKKVRLALLEDFSNINFNYYLKSDKGQVQNTLTGELDRVQQAFGTYFTALEQFFSVLVYVTFAFFVDFNSAFLLTLGGLLINILYKTIYSKTKKASYRYTDSSNFLQSQILQYVHNFKYFHATSTYKIYLEKIRNTVFGIENTRRRIGFYNSILSAAREPIVLFVFCIIIYIQVNILDGVLGSILISFLFFYRALTNLTLMQSSWNGYIGLSGSINNMKLFSAELKNNQKLKPQEKFNGFHRNIKISNLSFNYDDRLVLDSINLEINKNECVAFIGESGSGKTTLINIICGLMTYKSGSITIDGQELSQIDKTTYQSKIGYITQEPVIFNDTLFNNITLWDEKNKKNIDRFNNVIDQSVLLDLITQLPNKEDTVLGSNGMNLSGGQRQRISIARELYKNKDILILDEATSSLDLGTEKLIKKTIDFIKKTCTVIIITHRLSTIDNVDKTYRLERGSLKSKI